MKRGNGGAIASLFQKHEAKRIAAVVIDVQAQGTPGTENLLQFSDSPPPVDTDPLTEIETEVQQTTPPSPHLPSGSSADTHLPFECDPAKRIPISSYDVNDQLEYQLGTFIDDMRKDDRFKGLKTLGELSIKLVETQKYVLYDLVYLLLKLVLILPIATASVERVFSAMSLVKNKLRNNMGNDLLNYCLVTFIKRELFLEVKEDDIVGAFMAMRRRKVEW